MSLNSSITTDDEFVGEKLVVNHSETGHTFQIVCDGSTLVATIQRLTESHSGVQLADQLLMCGRINLDPQQPLAYYKLPEANHEVFFFNKASLLADSPRPPPEVIDVPNVVIPSPSSPLNDSCPLDDLSDPALKALASYERQFRYHFNYAKASHVAQMQNLREQKVQERTLDTGRGNLEHTFKRLQQRYLEFVKCFTQQHRVHTELLANFERDVERLRSLRLHPTIQSEGRKCLLDLVKVHDLRKWREICLNSHRQFESKVSQLKMGFGELKRRVENVLSSMSSGNSKELEFFTNDHQKLVNDQEIIMPSLRTVCTKREKKSTQIYVSLIEGPLEYSALRTSALRMHSLFERFRSCVTVQVGVANFADTSRSLALSLASSGSEDEEDGTAEFRLSIKVLSDKVSLLSRHRSELLERCSRAEAALEEKTAQLKSLYTKHQLEKQAIHQNCSSYYLSAESVALFTAQYSGRPAYVIGQIVHIERRIMRLLTSPGTEVEARTDSMNSAGCSNRLSPVSVDVPNPYGLPAGCGYFIVTVAMLPETTCSSPS